MRAVWLLSPPSGKGTSVANRRAIRQPGDLPLRRGDFQFSILRLLIAMTACAVLLAFGRPRNIDQTTIAFLLIVVVVLILFNDWSWMHLRRAGKLMEQGKYAQALASCTRAIQARPDDPDRYCFRAAVHVQGNDLESAAADYTEAIRRQSRYAPAWEGRASLEIRRGNLQQAVDDATIALCLAPDNVNAALIRGFGYGRLGELEAALADLNGAVAAAPDSWPAHRVRAQVYFMAENYRAAIDDLSRFPGAWRSDEGAGIELAIARFKVGDYRTAFEIIEACLRDRPLSGVGLSFHALFLATCPEDSLRDGRRALELAQRAQQFPARDELSCMAALAAAYAELGLFDRAVEYGRRAAEVAPSNLRPRHEARLAGYEAGKPYRDWPRREPRCEEG